MNIQDALETLEANIVAMLNAAVITATVRPYRMIPQGHIPEVHISVTMIAPADVGAADGTAGYIEFGVTAFAPNPQRTVEELEAAEAWLNAFDELLGNTVRAWRTGWLKAKLLPTLRPASPPDLRGWRLSASRIRIFM
ncbi:MAG: hypothetical protein OT477_14845 [Chloroflexi bacterium]|nr:hypothetical protein [Chloroflexota bacterium]